MGLKFKVDGVDVTDKINLPSHEEIKNQIDGMEIPIPLPDAGKMWGIIQENIQLQQENYMLRSKLDQVRRLVD